MNQQRKSRKQGRGNPITTAISTWLDTLPPPLLELLTPLYENNLSPKAALLLRSPKRWVTYEPLVLLPSGSFTAAPWPTLLTSLSPSQTTPLWIAILSNISPASKNPLTHLAINEGIPLHTTSEEAETAASQPQQENLLRAPTSLRPLHGSFGSASPSSPPTESDFTSAFWVSTRQNGITQIWAPLYTMFSRGNIKEKARLLAFPPAAKGKEKGKWAVDLYAGIGYFVFSYAKLGMRVLCWEINPWSVEGLRRGAEKNGWSVRIVEGGELKREGVMEEVMEGEERIVVFLEDNRMARERLRGLDGGLEVGHMNCGFLPTSEPVWRDAWEIQKEGLSDGAGEEGWLHLHENVKEEDVEGRKGEVQRLVDGWGEEAGVRGEVVHVEMVKTYAPGVWHVVFDVRMSRIG